MMQVIIVLLLVALPVFGYLIYNQMRRNTSPSIKILEFILIFIFTISFGIFCLGILFHPHDYYTAIDPVDSHYSPFSSKHALTLALFFVLAIWSLSKLWLKGRALPPLLFVLNLVLVLIFIPICCAIILQVSSSTESSDGVLFIFLPITNILLSILVLIKTISQEISLAPEKTYRNKFLNYLNQKMAKAGQQPLWILLLLVPVFIIVVAILMLFGQDANSITKVFTETTTWHFSQKTHPPFLDHKGHYLCTVAVCGDPKVVKPIRLGKRHGHEIVVNRQLLIANAFEELIQELSPVLHKIIRAFYDKYGYPLSKKITTAKGSNLVYRLMKPLEYFFLIILYLCALNPEEKIAKQYEI